jgi:HPt (histidine-containing phosphotransfer) domain-containing protein
VPVVSVMRRGPAPVDLVHLARQTFGSAELEREVLRLFVQQGGGLVARIAAAASASERGEYAHRLKGSARAIGAMRVGRIAEALEAATTGSETAALSEDLGEAVSEVERFVADLLAPRD